jgi:hypothetical protein
VRRFQFDDGTSGFRFVRRETGEGLVAPVREIDDARRLNASPGARIGRLQNVQPIVVEQEGVFPEQLLELRDGRVAVGKGLDFELIGGSRDLSEVNFIAQSFRLDPWCYNAKRRGCSRYVPPPRRWSDPVDIACRLTGRILALTGGEPGDLCQPPAKRGPRWRHDARNAVTIMIAAFGGFLSQRSRYQGIAMSSRHAGWPKILWPASLR